MYCHVQGGGGVEIKFTKWSSAAVGVAKGKLEEVFSVKVHHW